jgi:hypothetical protein
VTTVSVAPHDPVSGVGAAPSPELEPPGLRRRRKATMMAAAAASVTVTTVRAVCWDAER